MKMENLRFVILDGRVNIKKILKEILYVERKVIFVLKYLIMINNLKNVIYGH